MCLRCYQLEEEIKELKEKLRDVSIDGWKGKDSLRIEKIGQDWKIFEHRQDKETGEIAKTFHIIPELNVSNLYEIIKLHCENIGDRTNYRKIVPSIIEHYHFPISIEEFNGGRNRRIYFLFYYFDIKILENLKFIKYGGRGNIVRLK